MQLTKTYIQACTCEDAWKSNITSGTVWCEKSVSLNKNQPRLRTFTPVQSLRLSTSAKILWYSHQIKKTGVRNLETCIACALTVYTSLHYPETHVCAQDFAPLGNLGTWVHKRCTSFFAFSLNYQKMCSTWAVKCTRTWKCPYKWCTTLRTKVHIRVVRKACKLWVHKQVSKLGTPVLFAVVLKVHVIL